VRLEVASGGAQYGRIVPELPEAAVAVETQEAPEGAGRMIMVDVRRRGCSADAAQPTLFGEHQIGLLCGDAIPPREVVATAATSNGERLATSLVVAGKAVTTAPVRVGARPWKAF
jgi:hypothetical protein